MADARSTYAELFKLASASREVEMVKEAIPWWLKGLGLAGLGGGAYALGRGSGLAQARKEQEGKISPALAFGGGLAAGLVGPHLLRGVGSALGVVPRAGEFTSI